MSPDFAQDLPFLTLDQACRLHARLDPPPSPPVNLGTTPHREGCALMLGAATGVLMEEQHLSAQDAWQRIAQAGYHGGLGVMSVAEQVLRTGHLDNPWGN